MIRINQLKLQIPHTEEALEKKIQKTLHLKKGDSFTYRIHRQSLDARRKPELFYVYTVDVTVSNENAVLKHCKGNIQKVEEKHYQIPSHGTDTLNAPRLTCPFFQYWMLHVCSLPVIPAVPVMSVVFPLSTS